MKNMRVYVVAMTACIILVITSISKMLYAAQVFSSNQGEQPYFAIFITYILPPIMDVVATIALAFLCASLALFFRKLEKGG